MNKKQIEEKLKEQEKCLKNKDRRITTLEDRWKNIIIGAVVLLVAALIILYFYGCFLYNEFLELEYGLTFHSGGVVVLHVFEALGFVGIIGIFYLAYWYYKL